MAGLVMTRVAVVGLVAAVLLHCATAQQVHVVGDSMGWKVPQDGAAAYANWAAPRKFVVGDTLVFNFATNSHDVLHVPKASYDACSSTNPIGSVMTAGPANVSLNAAGDQFFICTIGHHCQGGQKLAIHVSASTGATPPPMSPTDNDTASPPEDRSPAPKSPPSAGGPGPVAPESSDSSSFPIAESFWSCSLAIFMALLF